MKHRSKGAKHKEVKHKDNFERKDDRHDMELSPSISSLPTVKTYDGTDTFILENYIYGIRHNPVVKPVYFTFPSSKEGIPNLNGGDVEVSLRDIEDKSLLQQWAFKSIPGIDGAYSIQCAAAPYYPIYSPQFNIKVGPLLPTEENLNFTRWKLIEVEPASDHIIPNYTIQQWANGELDNNLYFDGGEGNRLKKENDFNDAYHQWSFIPKYTLDLDISSVQILNPQTMISGKELKVIAGQTVVDNTNGSGHIRHEIKFEHTQSNTATLSISESINLGTSLSITARAGGTFFGLELGGEITTSFSFNWSGEVTNTTQTEETSRLECTYGLDLDKAEKKTLVWQFKTMENQTWTPTIANIPIKGYMHMLTDSGQVVRKEVTGEQLTNLIKLENYLNPQTEGLMLFPEKHTATLQTTLVADMSYDLHAEVIGGNIMNIDEVEAIGQDVPIASSGYCTLL